MLACLPLPGWAESIAHAVATGADALAAPVATDARGAAQAEKADKADWAAPGQLSSPASEVAEPQLQPGADLAEQLLPAPAFHLAAWSGRTGPPRYAGAPLPEPDLPLLPRPPRG
ncbi:hypothetical protein [Cupriavidus necator]|uniref:hypothetical protein n=1 Tax=Cupriavidus necator TaxID=106590 RepID=UPI00339D51AA